MSFGDNAKHNAVLKVKTEFLRFQIVYFAISLSAKNTKSFMQTTELDRRRIETLLARILEPIRENYHVGPISQDRVLEALNALAAAAALVIHGAEEQSRGADARPEEFFRQALDRHLLDLDP